MEEGGKENHQTHKGSHPRISKNLVKTKANI